MKLSISRQQKINSLWRSAYAVFLLINLAVLIYNGFFFTARRQAQQQITIDKIYLVELNQSGLDKILTKD